MRLTAALALLVLAAPPSAAQEREFCFQAKPKPACNAFLLTNAGGAFVIGVRTNSGNTPLRGIVDWGVMFNVSPPHAFGVTALVSLDEAGFGAGPTVRYRRWISAERSFDVGVGFPIVTTNNDGDLRAGSVLGMVRFNPVTWFAVAARPELLQRRVFVGPGCCDYRTEMRGRLSIGVEAGEVPGLVVTGLAGLAILGIYLLIATDNS